MIVLEIGVKTVISLNICCKCWSKHVYAFKNDEIAYFAKEIIKKNGLDYKIMLIKGKNDEVVCILPKSILSFEIELDTSYRTIPFARDKYLNKEIGKMFPDRAFMVNCFWGW